MREDIEILKRIKRREALADAAPAMYEALKTVQQALCLYHCQITAAKEYQNKHIKACNIARAALALVDGDQSGEEKSE